MTHVWPKLCGFVYYNVQYVLFIVAYKEDKEKVHY
jgi:hypothetical protein